MAGDFLKSLDKIPSKNAAYLWADYVELRCLVHPDRYFSLDGAEEALQEAADYSSDAEEPNLTSSNLGLDKLASRWEECERLLKNRESCFGDAYPFKVSDECKRPANTLLTWLPIASSARGQLI